LLEVIGDGSGYPRSRASRAAVRAAVFDEMVGKETNRAETRTFTVTGLGPGARRRWGGGGPGWRGEKGGGGGRKETAGGGGHNG